MTISSHSNSTGSDCFSHLLSHSFHITKEIMIFAMIYSVASSEVNRFRIHCKSVTWRGLFLAVPLFIKHIVFTASGTFLLCAGDKFMSTN
jgi:hypothetical protein